MNILLIGAGAREQAIAFKLSQSTQKSILFAWPDSVGMRQAARIIPAVSDDGFQSLTEACRQNHIDLVIVGPEVPLAEGVADSMQRAGIAVFGPNKFAAQLESSKHFSKDLMRKAGIPTADCSVHYDRNACKVEAEKILSRDGAVVLKASGLAAGKGVFVCKTQHELSEGVERLYDTDMKIAATEVLVEEFMVGREVSYFCTLGAKGITPIGFVVDHKRLNDGDVGPNTGGMGCYTPVPWLPNDAEALITSLVINPLIETFRKNEIEYCGWLYTGLMWTLDGPRVVEFNVRLGDPEAEVLAMADESDWLLDILQQVGIAKDVSSQSARKDFHPAVCVVMTSSDYPYGETPLESSQLPSEVLGLQGSDVTVWPASVKESEKRHSINTGRGRVLAVVGRGTDIKQAQQKVYAMIEKIKVLWPSAHFRHDIGNSAHQMLKEKI